MSIFKALKNYNEDFSDPSEINFILEQITKRINSEISQATDFAPDFLFKKEKEHLFLLPQRNIRSQFFLNLPEVNANRNALVYYSNKLFSVPVDYVGKKIQRQVIHNKLHLYYNQKYICSHDLSNSKKINILPSHQKQLDDVINVKKNKFKKIDNNKIFNGGIRYD
jgi:hypothetical protein